MRSVATYSFSCLIATSAIHLTGCATIVMPVNEYNLARTAMEAAQESEAARFAPALWYKAELAYREGQALYRDRDFNGARVRFEAARTFAEQAENAARIGRSETDGSGQ